MLPKAVTSPQIERRTEMKKYNEMNKHEKAAYRAIKDEYGWMMGGWYNAYTDGYDVVEEELVPATREEAMEAVYEEAMSNKPKEIRFAGEQFCKELIEKLFDNDSDAEELSKAVWANKENKEDKEMKEVTREEARAQVVKNYTVKEMREALKEAGVKGISRAKKNELVEMMLDLEEKKSDEKSVTVKISKVHMYAFTGMYIGEFEAEDNGEYILVYTERKGELMFDRKTGKEITKRNKARYANRVERA